MKSEIKKVIQDTIIENLENFQLIEGGQQRTVGDLIENKVLTILKNTSHPLIEKIVQPRSKKSIEDLTLVSGGIKYYLDPKTHDKNSNFSMPNLTSISKIKKLFSSDSEELIYILIDYEIIENFVHIKKVDTLFIWEFGFDNLSIGALGNGQLQIKNKHNPIVISELGKEFWFTSFKFLVKNYLIKQQNKIHKQIIEWD